MKISNNQAELLAKEIIRQLKLKKIDKVSDKMKATLKEYFSEYSKLEKAIDVAREKKDQHAKQLKVVIGSSISRKYDAYDGYDRIIEKLEEENVPALQEIKDEIILKSMFATEDDMNKFVDRIVNKYSKKLQTKIPVN